MKSRILPAKPKLFADPLILEETPVLIIADSHCPYQNADMLHKAFSIARKKNIKTLIHAGDLIDAAECNSQAKNEVFYPIEDEIKAARSIIDTAAQWFDTMIFMPGNHDHFYLKKNKVSFETLVMDHIDNHKHLLITTEYDYVFYGDFAVIGHPSNYDPEAGTLALKLAQKYNRHALIAHDHIRGYKEDNGLFGISIGMSAINYAFWYKERSFSLFPDSELGFIIIKNREIWQYDENGKGIKIV